MRKVAIMTSEMNSYGGIQRVITNLANELSKKEYIVDIVLTDQKDSSSVYKLDERCNIVNVDCKCNNIQTKIKKGISYLAKGVLNDKAQYKLCFSNFNTKKLESVLNEYDIVIANDGQYSALLSMLNIEGKKIGLQHNSFEVYANNYYKNRFDLYLRLYKKLDKLVVLNNVYKKQYEKHGLNNILVIPNFIYPTDNKNDNKLDKKIIISAGRMSENGHKGFDLLIESFSYIYDKCKDWELHIYGEGPMKDEYYSRIREYGIDDKVKIYNFTNDLQSKMMNASIYALSSRWEGFPMVALEAMECKLPIVSFDIDATEGIIIQNKNGVIASKYNTEEYGDNLLEIMNNNSLINQYGKESQKIVKQFYVNSLINMWIDIMK